MNSYRAQFSFVHVDTSFHALQCSLNVLWVLKYVKFKFLKVAKVSIKPDSKLLHMYHRRQKIKTE